MKGSVKLPVFIDDARKLVNTTQLRAKYLGATYEAEYCQWQALHGLGSLMETASLIITPNAYLEGKLIASYPPDPIGDFDVTRATTATRVNSSGLVELVPYNLVQYSEDFANGYWINFQSSETSNNTTAPNGTLTADRMTQTGAGSGSIYTSSVSLSGLYTASCYFKAGTSDFVTIDSNGTAGYWGAAFNLTTLAITYFGSGINGIIEDIGDGWFRCSVSVNSTGDNYLAFGIIGNVSDYIYLWGAQLNEGTIKPYQKTETRLNIPRLDYSNGTCPSLLVEPQRTNVCLQSSNLTSVWSNGGGATITANATTAPDGTLTADRVQFVTGSAGYVYQTLSGLSAGNVTLSGYFKSVSGNATIGFNDGNFFANSINITNEWQRFTFTFNYAGGGVGFQIDNYFGVSPSQQAKDFYVWGLQAELGSYPTSYIPTTSASVTRNADVISKTGISSLIGQTEGTIFWDVDFNVVANNDAIFIKDNASYDTFVFMQKESSGIIACGYYGSGALQARIESSAVTTGRYKIAFAYKNNDFVMYLNGTQVGTDTSGTVSGLMDYFDLHWTETGCNNAYASALWKTRLTNTQLAALTTI
jgi:hypothetical protein